MAENHHKLSTPILTASQWSNIDTVLLDMDGTLLDLNFDDVFWRQQLPIEYAKHHEVELPIATEFINEVARINYGKLDWYCIDFWSNTVGFDIRPSKQKLTYLIQFRPGAIAFLQWLKSEEKHVILATNAHPDGIALKETQTDLLQWVDRVLHAHEAGAPKESTTYWQWVSEETGYCAQQSLFIDDNDHILDSARAAGVGYCLGVNTPNSERPSKASRYPAFAHFHEIYPVA